MEVFAGKAQLSKFLRKVGFQVVSVDHKPSKTAPILVIDITCPKQCRVLDELIERGNLFYVHFAPPCGTASAARNLRLSKKRHGSPPLRTLRQPMGKTTLTYVQKLRVKQANVLYAKTWFYVSKLHRRHVGWSVENPATSLMWLTDPFVELATILKGEFIGLTFHTCMFAAPRKKTTALWTNVQELLGLARTCDGTHQHASWGLTDKATFATAEECAYNPTLCSYWADCIQKFAVAEGLCPGPNDLEEAHGATGILRLHVNQALSGIQPRGAKLPPLLTDFLQKQVVPFQKFPFLKVSKPGSRLPPSPHFPPGSRFLSVENCNGGEMLDMNDNIHAIVGIPVSPMMYLEHVFRLTHPALMAMKLEADCEKAVLMNTGCSLELRRNRLEASQKLVELRKDSTVVENEWSARRAGHLKFIYKGKRFALMQAALQYCGYEDDKIAAEASDGFPLVGWLPESGVFESKLRSPEMHTSQLDEMANLVSKKALATIKASEDVELDKGVWQATLDEADAGFLVGPLAVHHLPVDAVLSPRFGLRQGAKLRPIDNYTASLVNATVGLPERLEVEAIDEVIAMTRRMLQLSGGSCSLVGRTFDLRKAYRQLGVHQDHLKYSWGGVWNPELKRVEVFQMRSLPFGATASVAAFLRASRALRTLGTRMGLLVWTSFFDDFIVVSRPEDARSAELTVKFIFDALGWDLSADPEKDAGFAEVFNALGVTIDLRRTRYGEVLIGNTDKRKAELSRMMDEILAEDRMTVKTAESLRSRLTFAEAQVYGRSAKVALRAIGSPVVLQRDMKPLSDDVRFALRWMRDRIVDAVPRVVTYKAAQTYYMFFDGACEPAEGGNMKTTVGGVLFGPNGGALSCFGREVPQCVTSHWSCGKRKQLVFEAEVMPYLLGLRLWGDIVRNELLLIFLDNEGARHSWIAGSADSFHARKMIHHGTLLESKLCVGAHFARVPTFSNIADAPSRLDFSQCIALGAEVVEISDELMFACAGLA